MMLCATSFVTSPTLLLPPPLTTHVLSRLFRTTSLSCKSLTRRSPSSLLSSPSRSPSSLLSSPSRPSFTRSTRPSPSLPTFLKPTHPSFLSQPSPLLSAALLSKSTSSTFLSSPLPPTHSQQRVRYFRASLPPRAGLHVFRLVHFVAPIVGRQVKAWIGTPSTNAHFKRNLFIVICIILGIPIAYITTHLEATPYTDRLRFVALTSDDERKLGELAFNQLLEEHETNFIPDHHHFVAHVTEVAQRIIGASDRPDIKWEVRLIDSPITNAFAIPGGKIFVFSGLLNVTQNDDGLAFILGHEVAHVLARHGAEQMAVGRVMLGVSVLLSALFGDNIGSFVLARVISLLTELQYSRNMEKEADYIGLLLMYKARYNINEAPKVWERMTQVTGGEDHGTSYLDTHPSHGDRIIEINKWIEEIKSGRTKLIEA